MIPSVYERLHITPGVSAVIVSLALMLIAGFAMTRLTSKLRLPNVTAYIVSGILLGPFCLDLVPRGVIDGMSFLADIALAFIAFSTGEFFRISTLKKSGAKVLVITVLEACLASALVFLVCYFPLGLDLNFSLVLGALAAATAPASTVMTIRQTGAKGDFVDTLLQVVALDGAVLPDGKRIFNGELRGVKSLGMLCGGSELGLTDADYEGADVDGILILKPDTKVGVDINEI